MFLFLFFPDGGFLQFGTPNTFSAAALLGETDFKCVIVMPAYRVSVFGFLSSVELERDAEMFGEPSGNQGFWDQRMALEWTKENIGYFGGNPDNITIAGYSAGEYLGVDTELVERDGIMLTLCRLVLRLLSACIRSLSTGRQRHH